MEGVLVNVPVGNSGSDFVVRTRFNSFMERFKKLIKNLSIYYERGNLDNLLIVLDQLIRDLIDFKHSEKLNSEYLSEVNHQVLILGLLRASLIDVVEKKPHGVEDFLIILNMINYGRYNLPKPQVRDFK